APPSRPAAGITQAVYPVSRDKKTDLLDAMLSGDDVGSVIVFARTKHGADRLAKLLMRRGHSVASLHGNRSQSQRERALSDLRRGRVQVLVATDIASRGIDVEGITHVINYDVPHTPEDYVHRIGRTGRVEAVGDAFTLMAPEEGKQMSAIERFLGRAIPRVTLPDFDYKARPAPERGHGADRPRSGGRDDSRHGRGPRGGRGEERPGRGGGGRRDDRHGRSGAHGQPARRSHADQGGPSSHQGAPQGGKPASGDSSSHGRRPRRETTAERIRRRRI
ncbi:MAG: helicase-related protein, partial [Hyphomicrobiales bacterium]